jgi:hypothetical protein
MWPNQSASSLTLIRIFEQLRERGYEGGYYAVRRHAKRWAKQHGQRERIRILAAHHRKSTVHCFQRGRVMRIADASGCARSRNVR